MKRVIKISLFFTHLFSCFLLADNVNFVYPTWADYMRALLDLKKRGSVYEVAFENCCKLPVGEQTGSWCEKRVLNELGLTDVLREYLNVKYYNKNI